MRSKRRPRADRSSLLEVHRTTTQRYLTLRNGFKHNNITSYCINRYSQRAALKFPSPGSDHIKMEQARSMPPSSSKRRKEKYKRSSAVAASEKHAISAAEVNPSQARKMAYYNDLNERRIPGDNRSASTDPASADENHGDIEAALIAAAASDSALPEVEGVPIEPMTSEEQEELRRLRRMMRNVPEVQVEQEQNESGEELEASSNADGGSSSKRTTGAYYSSDVPMCPYPYIAFFNTTISLVHFSIVCCSLW